MGSLDSSFSVADDDVLLSAKHGGCERPAKEAILFLFGAGDFGYCFLPFTSTEHLPGCFTGDEKHGDRIEEYPCSALLASDIRG